MMHRCGIFVACCVLLVVLDFGTTKTWHGRVRRDGGDVTGGVKNDGYCPTPSDLNGKYAGIDPCLDDCRISLRDYDCGDVQKCCPTYCNGLSHACMDPAPVSNSVEKSDDI